MRGHAPRLRRRRQVFATRFPARALRRSAPDNRAVGHLLGRSNDSICVITGAPALRGSVRRSSPAGSRYQRSARRLCGSGRRSTRLPVQPPQQAGHGLGGHQQAPRQPRTGNPRLLLELVQGHQMGERHIGAAAQPHLDRVAEQVHQAFQQIADLLFGRARADCGEWHRPYAYLPNKVA